MDTIRTEPLAVGVAPDGTVSAATPLGTLVVELERAHTGLPEVVASVQDSIGSAPRELARFPLRKFVAMMLRSRRAARRHRPRAPFVDVPLPWPLRRAQRVALAKFIRVNFEALLLMAHAPRLAFRA